MDGVTVDVRQSGRAIEIRAEAAIDAPYEVVWTTLTDYDHLAEFIPGMFRSRIVSRRGPVCEVEQVGEARALFFSFPIDVTVASTENAPNSIDIKVLKGNLRRLDGGYKIERLGPEEIRLRWTGLIEPEGVFPPFVGAALFRPTIRIQFEGMVAEIRRREAARRGQQTAAGLGE